ncbi:hypothetical protein HDU80_009937 [Chytriomyces hyalinus]|nr:hypothetical protein HDU80_009937 [Chytriomyces hyalinus]
MEAKDSPFSVPKWGPTSYVRAFVYVASGMAVSVQLFVLLVLLTPFAVVAPPLFRLISRWAVGVVTSWAVVVWSCFNGHVRFVLTGDMASLKDRAVFFCNHQTLLDWWFLGLFTWHANRIEGFKIILMHYLRNVPFFGWIAYLVGFIFFKQRLAMDQETLASALNPIPTRPKEPFWLFIFPEGFLVHKRNLLRTKDYIEKLKQEHPPPSTKYIPRQPEHVILPRSKGLWNIIQMLNPRDAVAPVDTFVDLTMGYWPSSRGYESGLYPEHAYSPINVFGIGGASVLSEMHIDVRVLDKGLLRTLKGLDENDFDDWLKKYWEGKDDLMRHFHKNGTFEGFSRTVDLGKQSLPVHEQRNYTDMGYGATQRSGFTVTSDGKVVFTVFPKFKDILNLGIVLLFPWVLVSLRGYLF